MSALVARRVTLLLQQSKKVSVGFRPFSPPRLPSNAACGCLFFSSASPSPNVELLIEALDRSEKIERLEKRSTQIPDEAKNYKTIIEQVWFAKYGYKTVLTREYPLNDAKIEIEFTDNDIVRGRYPTGEYDQPKPEQEKVKEKDTKQQQADDPKPDDDPPSYLDQKAIDINPESDDDPPAFKDGKMKIFGNMSSEEMQEQQSKFVEHLTGRKEAKKKAKDNPKTQPFVDVLFDVTIKRGNMSLIFSCMTQDGELRIDNVELAKEEPGNFLSVSRNSFFHFNEHEREYWKDFMRDKLGVNTDMTYFINNYVKYRERRLFINWMKEVKTLL
jgi:hypothetical protein